jgi:hypothetical protein
MIEFMRIALIIAANRAWLIRPKPIIGYAANVRIFDKLQIYYNQLHSN